MKSTRNQFTTRVWLLLLVDSCRDVGLLPLEKRVFHRIVFLSNCLAPLFKAVPSAGHIVKYKRGPFYPELQSHLDCLAVCQVIGLSELRYDDDEFGRWMEAKYAVNSYTRKVVERCCRTDYGKRLRSYLAGVTAGFASLDYRTWEGLALRDRTYDAPGRGEGFFINLSESRNNFSVQTAERFRAILPRGIFPSPQEEMLLYLRLLEHLTRQEKGAPS